MEQKQNWIQRNNLLFARVYAIYMGVFLLGYFAITYLGLFPVGGYEWQTPMLWAMGLGIFLGPIGAVLGVVGIINSKTEPNKKRQKLFILGTILSILLACSVVPLFFLTAIGSF